MYKLTEISIDGFWRKFTAKSSFRDEVNIIIGKNGTGKTTFMNLLHAVLAVDVDELYENEFNAIQIKLKNGNHFRTIKATKIENDASPFPVVIYQISQRKYTVRLYPGGDIRIVPPSVRRRAVEDSAEIRSVLSKFVSLASLSVYRMRNEAEVDPRERNVSRSVAPVDHRLNELMQRLTHYQLELSQEARQVSAELQKDVLVSLLYQDDGNTGVGYALDFDENKEKQGLILAYKQLGVTGPEITKRIQEHISRISSTVQQIKSTISGGPQKTMPFNFAPLEASKRARRVVDMSLEASAKTTEIFRQVNLFLQTVGSFISDKKFEFVGGDLVIEKNGQIHFSKLSSGEKQLLILLIEALLQKTRPYIFLADEPELSLHIAWQRAVLPAIKSLNPNAQIIVATHSPEVAGKYKGCIINMEDILNG